MTIVYPEATPSLGNTAVAVVQSIADTNAPDLSSEIGALSTVNVSCYFYGDFSASGTQTKGSAPRRLCDIVTLEQLGTASYTVADLQYTVNPQGDPADEANKAREALAPGTDVWLVERRGLAARTVAFAAGQRVNLYHVRLGVQNDTKTGDDEFSEYSITQGAVLVEPPIKDVVIVA